MIVQAFYAHLSADSGVGAITSNIFPHYIPQGQSTPAITYSVDSDDDQETFSGVSSLYEATVDVNCWDLEYLDAHSLADAVESALVGFSGDFGSLSPAVQVVHIRKERRFDLFESDTLLYRVSLQFLIAYY